MSTTIEKEVAIEELKNYLSDFLDDDFDVEKDYPKVLKAVMDGRLSFNEDKQPVYVLIEPMFKGKENEKRELTLKTRVLPSAGASLGKNLDLQKDQLTYGLAVMAHICGLPAIKELDHLCKKDYQLLQELCSVFM